MAARQQPASVYVQRITVKEMEPIKESVRLRIDFINAIKDRIKVLDETIKAGVIKIKAKLLFFTAFKTNCLTELQKTEMELEICRLLVEMRAKQDELKVYENRLKEYEQRYEEIVREMNNNFTQLYELAKSLKDEIQQFKENLDKHIPKEDDEIRLQVEFYLYIKHNLNEYYNDKKKVLKII